MRVKHITLAYGHGGQLSAHCVIAKEVGSPAGVKPVEWRLLTNRAVEGFNDAVQWIGWYRARWEIEMFFHVLKNGDKVEALQLASIEKLQRGLARMTNPSIRALGLHGGVRSARVRFSMVTLNLFAQALRPIPLIEELAHVKAY